MNGFFGGELAKIPAKIVKIKMLGWYKNILKSEEENNWKAALKFGQPIQIQQTRQLKLPYKLLNNLHSLSLS
ncbi:hypothetical protein DFO70_1223 [Cytobacillus firmus]|uniref:Uncharacterized protein n=2 Tax=Cytobacillus TaxID=2675230 RepID=A0A366JIQ5_CYTFI|nr:hypothetical protein DFO70_1223 [Cytobacillus firmus]TDX46924.1 hypothetical protein DFO72_1013 [Cytobacillus oceanisediminis]